MVLYTHFEDVNQFVIHALENADSEEPEQFTDLASKIRKESLESDEVELSFDETETLAEALLREIQKRLNSSKTTDFN